MESSSSETSYSLTTLNPVFIKSSMEYIPLSLVIFSKAAFLEFAVPVSLEQANVRSANKDMTSSGTVRASIWPSRVCNY